ncbi:hypothetical protein LCGC14_2960870 [marine sediment metagenome]|uniref:Uncharacterized protein n=1 Tax=marine sediment metagenome TaxID=412755 RepID=A0A0F8ZK18_9ZZZZ
MNAEAVAESLAQAFHSMYETVERRSGYEDRDKPLTPWRAIPLKDRELTTATLDSMLAMGIIHAGSICMDRTRVRVEALRLLSLLATRVEEPGDCTSGNWPGCTPRERNACSHTECCDVLMDVDRFLEGE